jgi:hypothetical protein
MWFHAANIQQAVVAPDAAMPGKITASALVHNTGAQHAPTHVGRLRLRCL